MTSNGMKNRKKRERYAKEMSKLKAELGGRCRYCGSTENLEIEHLRRRNYELSNTGGSSRIKIYREEAKQGLIALACFVCQRRQGAQRKNSGYRNVGHHRTDRKCFCSRCRAPLCRYILNKGQKGRHGGVHGLDIQPSGQPQKGWLSK